MPRFGNLTVNALHAQTFSVDSIQVEGITMSKVDLGWGPILDIDHEIKVPAVNIEDVYLVENSHNQLESDTTFKAPSVIVTAPITLDGQLATKGYVDTQVGGVPFALAWRDPVDELWDASVALPVGPSLGDRYICMVAGNGWVKNTIYEWTGAAWSGSGPSEGWTMYSNLDNAVFTFNGTDWVHIGVTIDHTDLINKGTLTHSTIDSYLNQAVKSSSSPSFTGLTVTTTCSIPAGSMPAAGGNTQIQYNSSGAFGATNRFTYTNNGTTYAGVNVYSPDGNRYIQLACDSDNDLSGLFTTATYLDLWAGNKRSARLESNGQMVLYNTTGTSTVTLGQDGANGLKTNGFFKLLNGTKYFQLQLSDVSDAGGIVTDTSDIQFWNGHIAPQKTLTVKPNGQMTLFNTAGTSSVTIGDDGSNGLKIWGPLSLANVLTVANGGTGIATATAYAPICSGTSATGNFQAASTGLATAGFVLTSSGAAALPEFKAAPLTPSGSIDHTGIANKGTLTHDTIDSYLNQAVKSSSSPSFAGLTVQDNGVYFSQIKVYSPNGSKLLQLTTDQQNDLTQIYSTATTLELWANLKKTVSIDPASGLKIWDAGGTQYVTFYITNLGNVAVDISGSYFSFGALTDVKVLKNTASTSTTTGALTVEGGIGTKDKVHCDHIVQSGANSYWEDLNLIGLARTSGGTAPTFSQVSGTGLYSWSFSYQDDNTLYFQSQIPHSIKKVMVPHIHWCPTTTSVNNVVWEMSWTITKATGSVFTSQVTEKVTVAAPGVAYQGVQTDFGAIDTSNIGTVDYRPSGVLLMRITRCAGTDAADTVNSNVFLNGFDLHYEIYQLGGSAASYP